MIIVLLVNGRRTVDCDKISKGIEAAADQAQQQHHQKMLHRASRARS
jgi:hypothetical protein